ncbi:MAG: hypothetical protein WCI43_03415 [Candidatus Firestonebacteria bacterium]
MREYLENPYVKLAAIKAIERYGVSVNKKGNVLLLKKLKALKLKATADIKKTFKVRFNKSDISVNLASALAVLEIRKRKAAK